MYFASCRARIGRLRAGFLTLTLKIVGATNSKESSGMKAAMCIRLFTAAVCLLISAPVAAVEINFETPIKIGDGSQGIPTYGPGNQIIFNGTDLNVGWNSTDPLSREEEIRFVQSNDGGQSWEQSDVIVRGSYHSNGAAMAVGAYQENTEYHYAFADKSSGAIYYANSSDRTPIDVTGGDTGISGNRDSRSIAADQNGNIYVCFQGGAWADRHIYCSRLITDLSGEVSLDPSETAVPASNPAHDTGPYGEPAIAVDSNGTLFGVWNEEIDGTWEIVLGKRVSADNWTYQVVDRQGYAYGFWYTSIAIADIGGMKKICVGWSWDEVMVSCTTDEGATWNTSMVYDMEWADWRPSVAIASDGTVNVAWAHNGDDSVKFARELKDKKGSKWEVVEVDIQHYVFDVKLALDENDLAHLVYPGKDWGTLMYTKEIPVILTTPARP
jgi:hypothetical protein